MFMQERERARAREGEHLRTDLPRLVEGIKKHCSNDTALHRLPHADDERWDAERVIGARDNDCPALLASRQLEGKCNNEQKACESIGIVSVKTYGGIIHAISRDGGQLFDSRSKTRASSRVTVQS